MDQQLASYNKIWQAESGAPYPRFILEMNEDKENTNF